MLCCGAGGGDAATEADGNDTKFKVLEGRWIIEKDAIGEGGFGTVHLCKNIKTGKQRACKAMRLPTLLDRDDFRHEVAILKQIKIHCGNAQTNGAIVPTQLHPPLTACPQRVIPAFQKQSLLRIHGVSLCWRHTK